MKGTKMTRQRIDFGSHGKRAKQVYKILVQDTRRHAEIIHFQILGIGWWSVYYLPIRKETI